MKLFFTKYFFSILSLTLILTEKTSAASKIIDAMRGAITATNLELDNPDPELAVNRLITTIMSFLGVAFMILIIYGGFQWMFARGNEDQINKAKKLIINSTIGLFIIIGAYLITFLVISIAAQIA